MFNKIRACLLSAALAVAALGATPAPAEAALVNGWNLFRVSYCYAVKAAPGTGFALMYVVDISGDFIIVTDEIIIAATAQLCANGNAFWINLSLPDTILAVEFVPGLQ
jgi:hypothetical protein